MPNQLFLRTRVILPTGNVDLDESPPGYPGTPDIVNGRAIRLRQGQFIFVNVFAGYPVAVSPAPTVRVSFRATEWDLAADGTWVRDARMNDREAFIEHRYVNGSWTSLGPQRILMGAGACAMSLRYSASNPVP